MSERARPGLREALVTPRLQREIEEAQHSGLVPELKPLDPGDAADRLARHVQRVVLDAIGRIGDNESVATEARDLVARALASVGDREVDTADDVPVDPPAVLEALLKPQPDGTVRRISRPLTPLSDTTLLTNARGEPALGSELQAEIDSADAIDVVVAFVRFSGIRPLLSALERHCREGRRLRVLTTTYTGSTEQSALDALKALGAEIRVSYDTTVTRLHAKAWLFRRQSPYTTAYVGSSNLTHSAQVAGLEWNVRLSGVRNPDAVAKVEAVFESYWEGGDFVDYDAAEFASNVAVGERSSPFILSPLEVVLRPFQERMLEQVALARIAGRHRNLIVAATGTGKTVMAAVDYARLREKLRTSRLLFVAHRNEILEQSLALFRHALREPTFGELWVGRQRPREFENVFASVQSLDHFIDNIDPERYDVVIVDEFHHAAAPTYQRLLTRLSPLELLGLTATPERADGLSVLDYFDGEIAAELRIWDAIDQQYLAPFAYYGIHDSIDLRDVPWRRGRGYDVSALEKVFTADHAWAHRVIDQVSRYVGDVGSMRAIGFCVSVAHALFMAERFTSAGIPAAALSAASSFDERRAALENLRAGRLSAVFAVDIFNEGVDVPTVDTILMLRPTESATLFLQQLGRGLRRSEGKTVCTVLDFVGLHRREFRFDRRLRALLGGTRRDVERQIEQNFPFLPAGCTLELDRVARDVVLQSIRTALPSRWNEKVDELRICGDVNLSQYLEMTGLDLEDIYAGNRSWSQLRRAAGLPVAVSGPQEDRLLRALGRLLHVNDRERLSAYREFIAAEVAPEIDALSVREQRFARMLIDSLDTDRGDLADGVTRLWEHPQVRRELVDLLSVLHSRVDHLTPSLDLDLGVPIAVHGRYTRREIVGAFSSDPRGPSRPWREGVLWIPELSTDVFAFTLDKTSGSFSPTTRYRDYAISPTLVHWESQSGTSVESPTGRRYRRQRRDGTNVVLFARLRADERAFWCLGAADYVRHEGSRPVAVVWELRKALPGDLYAAFAAVAA